MQIIVWCLSLILSCVSVEGLNVYETCPHAPTECPANSTCKQNGCQMECLCDTNYIANGDYSACVEGLNVYDACSHAPTKCPANSTCKRNGCQMECLCDPNYIANEGYSACIEAKQLGEPCNTNVRCASRLAYCNNGTCDCQIYYDKTGRNTCVFKGFKAIGGSCMKSEDCFDVTSDCLGGVCQCQRGFGFRTEEEYWANPAIYDMVECVNESSSPLSCDATTTSTPAITTSCAPTTSAVIPTNSSASTFLSLSTATSVTAPTTKLEPTSTATTTSTTTSVGGVRMVFETCTKDEQCPQNALCRPNGCNGDMCLCNPGYVASEDYRQCLKAVPIDKKCNATTKCISFMAHCLRGRCACYQVFRRSINNTCYWRNHKRIGELCHVTDRCGDRHSDCINGICVCAPGYRVKTAEEYWVNPDSYQESVPTNFSLAICTDTSTTTLPSTTAQPTTSTGPEERMIFQTCTKDEQCPQNSQCRPNGCHGDNCLCNPEYIASKDHRQCLKAASIGEKCNATTKCVSFMAHCLKDRCACYQVFRRSVNNTCYWRNYKRIGELCHVTDRCGDRHSDCVIGMCVCAPGYRVKTAEEYWIKTDSDQECVPTNFSLTACTDRTTTTLPTTAAPPTTPRGPGGLSLYGNCTSSRECPVNAACQPYGCQGVVCLCDPGYAPSKDNKTCVKAGLISDSCVSNDNCVSFMSTCYFGKCQCRLLFRKTNRNTCSWRWTSVIGENCSTNTDCVDYPSAVCLKGICQCARRFRFRTQYEFWVNQDYANECKPVTFSLNYCNGKPVVAPKAMGLRSLNPPWPAALTSSSSPAASFSFVTFFTGMFVLKQMLFM